MLKLNLAVAAAVAAAFAVAACAPSNQSAVTNDDDYAAGAQSAATTSTTIADAAVASDDFTTLVAALQAAGLVETLSGAGPFTVFAPTDAAFAKLPNGTVETLTQPENRAQLTGILTYHVVPGSISAADLISQINAGGGSASLTTVQGATLTASLSGESVVITDAAGGMSTVTAVDLTQSNGVIHVIDTVLMPAAG
jgi:uncharacterized surface protein with fasciclin (FAS1) repeats